MENFREIGEENDLVDFKFNFFFVIAVKIVKECSKISRSKYYFQELAVWSLDSFIIEEIFVRQIDRYKILLLCLIPKEQIESILFFPPRVSFESIYRCSLKQTTFPMQLLSYQNVVSWKILHQINPACEEIEKNSLFICKILRILIIQRK